MRRFNYVRGRNPNKPVPIEERFWQYVEKTDGCWNWTANRDRDGYGLIKGILDGRRTTLVAHKVSFALSGGVIPKGCQLDHLCRNPRCVRPEHLEVVTGRENNSRSASPSAVNAKKTHCIHGHELTPSNCRIDRKGHRRCKVCDRKRKS
ncbi:MAG: hypothetical protein JWO19_4397 [Bryobacterales bacterium]|nr:hypothetical protein [Bryobacterales bacterium]